MKHTSIRTFIVVGVLLLAIGSGIAVRIGIARAATPVILDSHVDPAIADAQLIGPAPESLQIHLSVGLQMRNGEEFNNLLAAITDPASPLYQQYLTPDQFTDRFAPTDDQVQQVKDFLQSNDMIVQKVAPDNLLLDVNATAAQAERAFNVQINSYKQGSQTFYANASPIEVPLNLRSLMTVVAGLDSNAHLHHNLQKAKSASKAAPVGYKPKDIAGAYNIGPLQNAGFLGDKQTIALFELDGYLPTDVGNYVQSFNPASVAASALSASVSVANLSNVLVDGYNGVAGANALEVSMDIELVDAIAPRANILVYEGPNTQQGTNDTYAKIINDNKAQVVSISWGACEAGTGNTEMQLLDNLFKQGAAQGMSFFAGSGDSGAYDCGDSSLGVDVPASDPYVTSVGGTSLQLNADGTTASESVWSDPAAFNDVGSGGGLSSYFSLPSWERGAGVSNSYSNGKREVPDVSANADINYGYAIYCTLPNSTGGIGWNVVAGTSAAAPIWAASALLINQYMQAQGKRLLGQANSTLFGLFNGNRTYPAFNDITTGSNLYYPATANYDLASGLGSPNVFNIARDLAINAGGTAITSSSTSTSATTTLAQETFQGANQTYWGTTSSGQIWGGDANSSNAFTIANNNGVITNSGATSNAILGSLLTTNSEVSFTGSLSNYNDNTLGAVLHWTDANNTYKAYLDGASLIVQKTVLGITTVIASVPFTANGGTAYNLRFRIAGTNLYAVAWAKNATQPTSWMISTTDSSLLLGSYGLSVQELTNSIATFTAFQAAV